MALLVEHERQSNVYTTKATDEDLRDHGFVRAGQARVDSWMRVAFTKEEIANGPERTLRHVEEALELAQACNVDAATLHRLVDYVFSRPVGKPAQEIAGSMVTLYAAASALGVDAQAAFEAELVRIQQPEVIERCRRRQHEKREALAASGPINALVDVSPQDTTQLPPKMIEELVWFLRGKTHWEAWAERDLETVLGEPNHMDAPNGPICTCGKPSTRESGWCGKCQVKRGPF